MSENMREYQCPSCGGFCRKGHCERASYIPEDRCKNGAYCEKGMLLSEIDALNAKINTLIQQNGELEKALDLLDAVYGMYEDGITCYEEPDDYGGYVGMAIHIPEDVENEIVDLLNKHKPRQPLGQIKDD